MKRRFFLSQATMGAALLGAAQSQDTAAAPPTVEKRPLVLTPPVAMAAREDGFEVVWAVSRLSRGWLEVREPQGKTHVFRSDTFGMTPQSDKALRLRAAGLAAGTRHEYRIVTEAVDEPAEKVEGEWRAISTLNSAATETRWAVWNDTHLHDDTIQKLHEVTPPSDFLVWNGDICNDWTKESLLIPALLHPGGTDYTAQRPMAFIWGNHDIRGKYGFQLSHYTATPSGRPFYAFRSGPVAVVCLHTGEDKPDDHPSFKGRVACEPLRQEQKEWLERHVLNEPSLRDAPYRVVFCHIPLRWTDENMEGRSYDSFSKRSRDLWHDALVKWGAQAVISGHMHRDALIPANDVFPYAQLVGGGPKMDRATWMEGKADASQLQVKVRGLDGTVRHELTLKPIV